MTRARAWLEVMRISNLPTVVSNAIAGAALGAAALAAARAETAGLRIFAGGVVTTDGGPSFAAVLAAMLAPPFAYVGGMILNDAFDAAIDARERPSRPIPSGRIARRHAFAAGFALLALALVLAAPGGIASLAAATALVVAIVVYDGLHAKSAASTLLLALCRALAAIVPMLAAADGDLRALVLHGALILPAALAAWTLGLSLVARGEARMLADQRRDEVDSVERCGRCGHRVRSGTEACPECGAGIGGAAKSQATARGRLRPSRLLLDVAPIAGVALVALALRYSATLLDAPRTLDPLVSPLVIPLAIVALVCIWTADAARRRMRRDARETPAAIAAWIACMALIDACALLAFGDWLLAIVCVGLFGATRVLQSRIAGS